jgi:hypothetical protein
MSELVDIRGENLGSAHHCEPDAFARQVQHHGHRVCRHDQPRHDNEVVALLSIEGEPQTAPADILDTPDPGRENIGHLVRVFDRRQLNIELKHRSPPSAIPQIECTVENRASHKFLRCHKARRRGYRPVNGWSKRPSPALRSALAIDTAATPNGPATPMQRAA